MKFSSPRFGAKPLLKNAEALATALVIAGNVFLGGKDSFLSLSRLQVFPFFSWSLYSSVPQTESEYVIRLPEMGDRSMAELFSDSRTYFLVQRFSEAYAKGDGAAEGALLNDVRDELSRYPVTRFTIEEVSGNPVRYYQEGIGSVRQIASVQL